jgi:uncharacterized RDD family membrane protein YckC
MGQSGDDRSRDRTRLHLRLWTHLAALFRAGLTLAAIVPIALAADTVSITIMEVIDNLTVVLIPGAMEAGVDEPLLYASVAGGFAIAYPFAFPANRYMISRGKGHAVVHEYHH